MMAEGLVDEEALKRQRKTERNRRRHKRIHQENLQLVKEWKEAHPCKWCGETDLEELTFHHKDKGSKFGNIANGIGQWSRTKLLNEINKCDVLCRRCHDTLHRYG